jgi:hypothetical protein
MYDLQLRCRPAKVKDRRGERDRDKDGNRGHQPAEVLADATLCRAECQHRGLRPLPLLHNPFQFVAHIARRLPSFLRLLGHAFLHQVIEGGRRHGLE